MQSEKKERVRSLATHIVIRTAPGMLDEAGQPLAPGTAVDAAMWRPGVVAGWVNQRYLEPIVMDTATAGQQALARADRGIAELESRERALKAEASELEGRLAKLRREAGELEKYRVRLGEVERESAEAELLLGSLRNVLEQFPAQRARYEDERHRGRVLLDAVGAGEELRS